MSSSNSVQAVFLIARVLTEFYLNEETYYDSWPHDNYKLVNCSSAYLDYIQDIVVTGI
jgi:hypothetical protein